MKNAAFYVLFLLTIGCGSTQTPNLNSVALPETDSVNTPAHTPSKTCANHCSGICLGGKCTLLVQSGTKTINTVSTTALGTSGSLVLTVGSSTGFPIGQLVLIHQSQGTGAGHWETATIADVSNTTLSLAEPLSNTYLTGAQVVLIPKYDNVILSQAATLTAPAWNGSTGGILVFKSTGSTKIAGSVDMTGKGFRGYQSNTCPAVRDFCRVGNQGESSLGLGIQSQSNNGAGGGGGSQGQDCGMGAGGAYADTGGIGINHATGDCHVPGAPDASGGTSVGLADLAQSILFGGAGGEGGADEDGAYPGAGGNGGGIIVMLTHQLKVTGSINAQGGAGGSGVVDGNCDGSGCGMSGGGGGAGGAIRIVSDRSIELGTNLISAAGGVGGTCTCGETDSGVGSVGRIGILAESLTGSTVPAYDAH